jgi:hypothetical protein
LGSHNREDPFQSNPFFHYGMKGEERKTDTKKVDEDQIMRGRYLLLGLERAFNALFDEGMVQLSNS